MSAVDAMDIALQQLLAGPSHAWRFSAEDLR